MAQAMDFGGVWRAVEVFKEQGYGAGFGVVHGAEQAVAGAAMRSASKGVAPAP